MLSADPTLPRRTMRFVRGQHIHFVGIGGYGLSAIARILLERGGYKISGSDRSRNALTDALERDGATIYEGHDAANIKGANMLIISSAIQDNPEVAAARAARIPVYKRKDILESLMTGKNVVAIAGTHGKTTTTSMTVHILRELGEDPSYIVGGVMGNTGTNAGVGQGNVFVIEADEYDNMFHGLRPNCIVLTNVEYDHPDFFKTEEELLDSFRRFVGLIPKNGGNLFFCGDSGYAHTVAETVRYRFLVDAFGFNQNSTVVASNIRTDADGFTVFDVLVHLDERGKHLKQATCRIPLPGKHNILNAVGAMCAVMSVRGAADLEVYAKALETFKSTGRRFELRGESNGVMVIDDYAHHPTAIKVTLQAAKQRYPDREVWAVWQPHTYSRTRTLMGEYITAFGDADHILITDIYAARETAPDGSDAAQFAAAIAAKIDRARHSGDLAQTTQTLIAEVKSPAVIVIMSAGDAPKIGKDYLDWKS